MTSSIVRNLDAIGVLLLNSMIFIEDDYIEKGKIKTITLVTDDNCQFPVSLSVAWSFPGVNEGMWFGFLERLNQVAPEVKERIANSQ